MSVCEHRPEWIRQRGDGEVYCTVCRSTLLYEWKEGIDYGCTGECGSMCYRTGCAHHLAIQEDKIESIR